MEETKLDEHNLNKVLNNIDVVFDREEFNKTGAEKYILARLAQVPILVTLLDKKIIIILKILINIQLTGAGD